MLLHKPICKLRRLEVRSNREFDDAVRRVRHRPNDIRRELIGYVVNIGSESRERIANRNGTRRTVRLRRVRRQDVEARHDEHKPLIVQQQLRRGPDIARLHVRLQVRHTAHVVLEDDVLNLGKRVLSRHSWNRLRSIAGQAGLRSLPSLRRSGPLRTYVRASAST